MANLLSLINGSKTYLAAGGAGLLALHYLRSGDYAKANEFLVLALGLAGLRHALAKNAPPAPPTE